MKPPIDKIIGEAQKLSDQQLREVAAMAQGMVAVHKIEQEGCTL